MAGKMAFSMADQRAVATDALRVVHSAAWKVVWKVAAKGF
jgi:hypothetical protein